MKTMNKEEYNRWVSDIINEFIHDDNASHVYKAPYTILYDMTKGKSAFSKCHPNDVWDSKIGIAIAYARMRGKEIPKLVVYKKATELKNGDYFMFCNEKYMFIGKISRNLYAALDTDGRLCPIGIYDEVEMC